jgi:heterodisulfide reductase subunit B
VNEQAHPNDRYAFFVGCTVAYKLPHLEAASRRVLEALGVRLVDLPFSCCPDPNGIHSYSTDLWHALAARNLALAEAQGLDILTLCSGCYATLKLCRANLTGDPRLRRRVNGMLEAVQRHFSGNSRIVHLFEWLRRDIGYERLKELVVRPLHGLRIAVHYGCHSLRPKRMHPPEDAEQPRWLWEFVDQVLGAEAVHYLDETQCCGAGMREVRQDTALALARRKIQQMEAMGANAIVVPCPTCYQQFDAGQRLMLRSAGSGIHGTPVFYQAELLALAMGLTPEAIGLGYHLIKPDCLNLETENPKPRIR